MKKTGRVLPDLSPEAAAIYAQANEAYEQDQWLREEMSLSRSRMNERQAKMPIRLSVPMDTRRVTPRPLGCTSGEDHKYFHQTPSRSRTRYKNPHREITVMDVAWRGK